jgi:perosamine synthetase
MKRPPFIPFTQCLRAGDLLGLSKPPPPLPGLENNDGRSVFTYTGSTAIGLAAASLKQCHRTHLIAPAYHCGHEIEPFLRRDFKVDLCRVDRQAKIDLDHLDSLIKGHDQVVLVTHYFGFPQDIQGVHEICRAKGAYLLEDCAHAFLSRLGNRLLGSWGDISIFSYRKSLPIPDGGAVVFNNQDIPPTAPRAKPKFLAVWRKTAKLLTEHLLLSVEENSKLALAALHRLKKALLLAQSLLLNAGAKSNLAFYSPDDLSYDYRSDVLDWQISNVSLRIMAHLDLQSIFNRRRANYLYVHHALRETKLLRPLMGTLPEGACPLVFPLVAAEKGSKAQNVMVKHPFLFRTWSQGHPAVDAQRFSESEWLRKQCHIICIHQDMKKRHLDYLIDQALKADAEMS